MSTCYLEYGRHVARLRRRRAYAPTSNTASHDNHEKINSWVSFCFSYMGCLWGSAWLRAAGAPLKTHQIFSVHTTPEESENATVTGHSLRFACDENSVTREPKAGVFEFFQLESVFEKLRFRYGLVWTVGLTVVIKGSSLS